MNPVVESHSGRKATRSLLSPQPVILGIALAILLLMSATAFRPEFRGGGFLTSVLVIAVGLVAILLARVTMGYGLTRDASEDDVPLKMSDGGELEWTVILRAMAVMAGLFAMIVLLGMALGLTGAVFLIMLFQMRVSAPTAAAFALMWGVAVPAVFGIVLDVRIWPGLIPEIMPRWIGGGLLPPL
jgi:hypothetical protein